MKPTILVLVGLTGAFLYPAAATAERAASSIVGEIQLIGLTNLSDLASQTASQPAGIGGPELPATPLALRKPFRLSRAPLAKQSGLPAPAESALLYGVQREGFNGLDSYQQRYIADNGNQYTTEPPDQALAVGNGFVFEGVNDAVMVYDKKGTPLLVAPVSSNRFFGQESQILRTVNPPQSGPFLSDPRAYFDPSSRRFFVSELAILSAADGTFLNIALQFVAVSRTENPTGDWYIYAFETTSSTVPGCPCYGDFPQIGLDLNGLYISVDLLDIPTGTAFAGTRIYAVSKADLEAGNASLLLQFPLRHDFNINPTVIPPAGSFAAEDDGTEYLISDAADSSATGTGHGINLFAIGNTSSLNTTSPNLTLASVNVPSQTIIGGHGIPPALQRAGIRPLGGPTGLNDPLPTLDAAFADPTGTPVYVNGHVWAAVETDVGSATGGKAAVAWFDIAASGGASSLAGTMLHQGLVVAPGSISLLYPVIAMPVSGQGAIGLSLSGTSIYPSTAVVSLTEAGAGPIEVAAVGKRPDDGLTAYPQLGGSSAYVGRWGDYSAAAVDNEGHLYIGSEFIPTPPQTTQTLYANWGTRITVMK